MSKLDDLRRLREASYAPAPEPPIRPPAPTPPPMPQRPTAAPKPVERPWSDFKGYAPAGQCGWCDKRRHEAAERVRAHRERKRDT